MERKWTQHNVTITAAVVVLAMALLAAVVVTVVLARPDHPGETADTIMDKGVTTLSIEGTFTKDLGRIAPHGHHQPGHKLSRTPEAL